MGLAMSLALIWVCFGRRAAIGDEGHTDQSVRIYKEKEEEERTKGSELFEELCLEERERVEWEI